MRAWRVSGTALGPYRLRKEMEPYLNARLTHLSDFEMQSLVKTVPKWSSALSWFVISPLAEKIAALSDNYCFLVLRVI